MSADEIANAFIEGAKKITFGALIIGFSTAIGIVMTDGQIIYTVVHALGDSMAGMPKVIAA